MTHGKTTTTVIVILSKIAATKLIRKIRIARATQTTIAVMAIHSPPTANAHVSLVHTAAS